MWGPNKVVFDISIPTQKCDGQQVDSPFYIVRLGIQWPSAALFLAYVRRTDDSQSQTAF